jgi:hypothetical protein
MLGEMAAVVMMPVVVAMVAPVVAVGMGGGSRRRGHRRDERRGDRTDRGQLSRANDPPRRSHASWIGTAGRARSANVD